MPRIRTIKPEFWSSGQILECSKNARLLFVGLWNFSDDHGRHPYRLKQIKAEVFPGDDDTEDDISHMLTELEHVGLIYVYTVGNERFLEITGWHHQRIDKPQPARYPEPIRAPFQDHSKNDPGTFPPDSKGKDSKGKDTIEGSGAPQNGHAPPPKPKAVSKRATQLPEQWQPSERGRQYAEAHGLHEPSLGREVERMRNWATANTITRKDWDAQWRNWVLKFEDMGGGSRASPDQEAIARQKEREAVLRLVEDGDNKRSVRNGS